MTGVLAIALVWGTLALVGLYQLWSFGYPGGLFASRILETVGQVEILPERPGWMSVQVICRVHRLEASVPDAPVVGIEVRETSAVSFRVAPIRLSQGQAQSLSNGIAQSTVSSLDWLTELLRGGSYWPLRLSWDEAHRLGSFIGLAAQEKAQ
jgi:hypothetical protein